MADKARRAVQAIGLAAAALLLVPVCAIADGTNDAFRSTLLEFSALNRKLVTSLAEDLDLTVPEGVADFFSAAVAVDWLAVSNRFSSLLEARRSERMASPLANELWAPIHETMGIYEVWVGWKRDASLLELFHKPVLGSMPRGSVYFGGTDYGRFVIATVNATMAPPPLYCITQNRLADNVYMAHLRAVYGKDLWIPGPKDSAGAFQRYVREAQAGKRPTDAELTIEDGRVRVSGVSGVMEINGILCEMIFEHNKDTHDFFVEESYVLRWMYPYLEPHGLIMKLNKEPLLLLSDEVIERDTAFWVMCAQRLLARPGFIENFEARKAFSKMRSAIAGLYAHRKIYDDAERAFWEAVRLCPVSPEASFRLAQMYEEMGKTDKAADVMETFIGRDPPYSKDKAVEYLERLRGMGKLAPDRQDGEG